MRVLLGIAGLLAAGCQHVAAAPLTDPQAIALARAEAARRHMVVEGWPVDVSRSDAGVAVTFDRPECRVATCIHDSFVMFAINPQTRRVTLQEEPH